MTATVSDNSIESGTSLSRLVLLEALLFDTDGTLCYSDPLHYYAFRKMLQEVLVWSRSKQLWLDMVLSYFLMLQGPSIKARYRDGNNLSKSQEVYKAMILL